MHIHRIMQAKLTLRNVATWSLSYLTFSWRWIVAQTLQQSSWRGFGHPNLSLERLGLVLGEGNMAWRFIWAITVNSSRAMILRPMATWSLQMWAGLYWLLKHVPLRQTSSRIVWCAWRIFMRPSHLQWGWNWMARCLWVEVCLAMDPPTRHTMSMLRSPLFPSTGQDPVRSCQREFENLLEQV